MDKEILAGPIGADGKYDLTFKDGKLKIEASYDHGVTAAVSVAVGTDFLLDAMEKAIPGTIDDKVIELIKIALKAV